MITIKDVAKECAVHPTTVSKVINGSKEISEATKLRVLDACERLGYQPNLFARGLITKRSKMVGLIIPDLSNQFYSTVSMGIGNYLETKGYGLIFCNSERKREKQIKNIDYLVQAKVDGLIILPVSSEPKDYSLLIDHSIPFVFVDNYIHDLDVSFAGDDNYTGARKLVKYLLEQGYEKIGFILSTKQSTASNERLKAYVQIHEEMNKPVSQDYLINSNATFEDGYNNAKILIEKGVDSIFAINDTVAMGVLRYCFQNKISIPDDLGLCGYDDIEQASMLPVPLTTVRQDKFVLGNKAAEILLEKIENPTASIQRLILQPELIIRESTKKIR